MSLYTEDLKHLNNIFLWLEIFQCSLFAVGLYFICTDRLYGHLIFMWLEDVLLEIPLVWISFHITSYTNESITVLLVLAGGILGLVVALGDTYLELKDGQNTCGFCISSVITSCGNAIHSCLCGFLGFVNLGFAIGVTCDLLFFMICWDILNTNPIEKVNQEAARKDIDILSMFVALTELLYIFILAFAMLNVCILRCAKNANGNNCCILGFGITFTTLSSLGNIYLIICNILTGAMITRELSGYGYVDIQLAYYCFVIAVVKFLAGCLWTIFAIQVLTHM